MAASRDLVIKLAEAEAEAAFAEGWRKPVKNKVFAAAGYPKGSVAAYSNHNADISAIFESLRLRQCALIVETGEEIRDEGITPSADNIARRLGISPLALYKGKRFRGAIVEALGETRKGGKPRKRRKPREVAPEPEALGVVMQIRRDCRCGCTDCTDGQELIQGYLPNCWAEKQYWEAVDEGRLARLSA